MKINMTGRGRVRGEVQLLLLLMMMINMKIRWGRFHYLQLCPRVLPPLMELERRPFHTHHSLGRCPPTLIIIGVWRARQALNNLPEIACVCLHICHWWFGTPRSFLHHPHWTPFFRSFTLIRTYKQTHLQMLIPPASNDQLGGRWSSSSSHHPTHTIWKLIDI